MAKVVVASSLIRSDKSGFLRRISSVSIANSSFSNLIWALALQIFVSLSKLAFG